MSTRSTGEGLRAALLAARMSLDPVLPIDVLRFLRVPAIVWVMRRTSGWKKSGGWRRRTPKRHFTR